MFCTWLGYILLNCIKRHKTWPTFLNYSRNVSCYSFLECDVLYVDVILYSALDCSTLNFSVLDGFVQGLGTDCQTVLNSTCLDYSTIVSYYSVLYFDVLLWYTLDCSVLNWSALDCSTHNSSALEGIVHGWCTDYQTVLNSTILDPLL